MTLVIYYLLCIYIVVRCLTRDYKLRAVDCSIIHYCLTYNTNGLPDNTRVSMHMTYTVPALHVYAGFGAVAETTLGQTCNSEWCVLVLR